MKIIKELKNILDNLIYLPNILFIIIIGIYVLYKCYKNTGIVEFIMTDEDDKAEEVAIIVEKIYPIQIQIVVAVVFYLYMLKLFIL